MSNEQVDVVVVGLGVGGESVAGQLAQAGLSVVGIEGRLVGGECPYWGCIPSKMMVRGADLLAEARRVDGMAGHSVVVPDWRPVAQRIREEATTNWDDQIAVERFVGQGGRFVRGWGRITGQDSVEVDGTTYTAGRALVIGTGSSPVVPPIDGLAGTPYWTNHEAIEADPLPRSLLVLGGGAVGLELAQVFARFGVEVSVVEAAPRLLPAEEPESSELVEVALRADGVAVHTGVAVQSVAYDGAMFTAQGSDGSQLRAERLLVSVGRRAQLGSLGVDELGLDASAPSIEVDEWMRAAERVWAVGDVTGNGAFTHVATYQADIAVRDILGQDGSPADYRAVPRVTFTDPEVGSVGLTKERAEEAGHRVAIGVAAIPSTARGWLHKAGNNGLIKLVADAENDVLLGATSVGPNGGEVLGALAVACHAEVPLDRLRDMIYAYPTFHRGIQDALRALDG